MMEDRRSEAARGGRNWMVAMVVLFFPLVGGVIALFGAGSTQVAEASPAVISAESLGSAPSPSAPEIGFYSFTKDATPESVQIVSSGGIRAAGIIESSAGGFRFPDGTVQTTAAPGSTAAPARTGEGAPGGAFETQLRETHPNVVVVDRAGGGFATIAAALESIPDAGPTNPYLVYLAPGTYRERVQMKAYVNLEGAGENRTAIVSPGGGDQGATVLGAPNSALSKVRVEATGGRRQAVAIRATRATRTTRTTESAFVLTEVRVIARGGQLASIAIDHHAGPLTLRHVSTEATGGEEATGLRSDGLAPVVLANVSVRVADAAKQNIGVASSGGPGSKLEMTDVEIEATGAASFNTGVLCDGIDGIFFDGVRARAAGAQVINEGISLGPAAQGRAAPARIIGLWATASGGDVARALSAEARSVTVQSSNLVAEGALNNSGLWVRDGIATGGHHTIRILGSTIVADGQTVWSEAADASVAIGHSTLEGGPVFAERGAIKCAATIDEEWTFHPEGCPQ